MPPGQDGRRDGSWIHGMSSVPLVLQFCLTFSSGEHWYLVSDDAAELAGSVLSVSACASGTLSSTDERAAQTDVRAKSAECLCG